MSLLQKLFAIFSTTPQTAASSQSTTTRPSNQPPSESVRAWIRQGGLVAPVTIESLFPPSIVTRQDLDRLVADALAEFDAQHPGRRIAEPAEVRFDPANLAAPIEISVNLKYTNSADFKAGRDVMIAFFDIFERRKLPFIPSKATPANCSDIKINCEKCGQALTYRYWERISASGSPELKLKILDGTLFDVKCGVCGALVTVEQPLNYSDYSCGKNFFVLLCPRSIREASYEAIQMLPALRSNGTRIHVVNTVEELQHLIVSYDYGLTPPETIIDQSVDSAKKAEALNSQIDAVFESLAKGELPPGIAEQSKKK
jgi:hypothetical protein